MPSHSSFDRPWLRKISSGARPSRRTLAQWYGHYLPAPTPFSPRLSALGNLAWLEAAAFGPDVPKTRRASWLAAALAAMAAVHGEEAARAQLLAARAAERDATEEGYGLAWIGARSSSPSVNILAIEPVLAPIASLGVGTPARKRGTIPIWAWLRNHLVECGLTGPYMVALAPTRPFAIVRCEFGRIAGAEQVVEARRKVDDAMRRMLEQHLCDLSAMPGYLGPRPDLGVAPHSGTWDDMLTAFLAWHVEHPYRRPPHGSKLAHWVDEQRKRHRNGTLDGERLQRLRAAGFPFHGVPRPGDLERAACRTGSVGAASAHV